MSLKKILINKYYIYMSDCYNFTNYIPKNKHNIIEVGYVLTLKNSKNDFKKQLDLFSPSNN